jgi:hypothetical protein
VYCTVLVSNEDIPVWLVYMLLEQFGQLILLLQLLSLDLLKLFLKGTDLRYFVRFPCDEMAIGLLISRSSKIKFYKTCVVNPSQSNITIYKTYSRIYLHLWRACNLTSFSLCLTGPVDYPFASHHEGPGFKSSGGYLCEIGIAPVSVVLLHW